MDQDDSPSTRSSSLPLVILYWAVVAIPMSWGIYKTWQKSVPLFHTSDKAVGSAPATTPEPLAATAPTVTPTPEIAVSPTLGTEAAPAATVAPAATPAPPGS